MTKKYIWTDGELLAFAERVREVCAMEAASQVVLAHLTVVEPDGRQENKCAASIAKEIRALDLTKLLEPQCPK